MRDYLITIITATLAAWLLQQGAPPAPIAAGPTATSSGTTRG
ncbi:MAG: hypothetical protein P0Y64_01265 [Candidatus Sphingomonas colombiensis]|nr:hypothetical protein [Sphingomonas sp.]WEK43496.1 MAG: hypothetical protein P0Y64_01265 [Sphingomonas sp.]